MYAELADRNTIRPSDFLLLCRKNQGLYNYFSKLISISEQEEEKEKEKNKEKNIRKRKDNLNYKRDNQKRTKIINKKNKEK
ncbi:centromere protein s [Anaeramoeba flamelloides]|nr:centromere protein s [Anaeramoeba flamelloides]